MIRYLIIPRLYERGKYKETLNILEKSCSPKLFFNHELYLHLEEAKKAIASKKNN